MPADNPSTTFNFDTHLSAQPEGEVSLRNEIRSRIDFPPLPHTVDSVSQLLAEMSVEPNTLQLAQIVDSDPVVAASVLRRINSAYYGVRRRIASVQKAVMLLGFLEVANLVLTAGMTQLEETFNQDEEASHIFGEIMRLSIGTAQYARELANHLDLPCEGPAFTAGLLHAVGRLVLLHNYPDLYEMLWDREDAMVPSIEDEQDAFGIDHARLGGITADEWKLPGLLIKAIRYYPSPDALEEPEQRLVAEVVAAASSAMVEMGLHRGTAEEQAFALTPPVVALAESTDTKPEALAAFLEKKRPRIRSYVATMMQHT